MKTYGIRISDGKGEVLSPTLRDILEEINVGISFTWSILFLDGTPNPGEGTFLIDYEKKINDSKNGLVLSLEELKNLSGKFFQMFETTILGSYNSNLLHRYEEEKAMYRACDVVIELIDCAFWEVYAKDIKVIEKLQERFKETELLDLDITI
ncbi:MAG: hypothetical protein JSR76_01440 [Verrucomicrobia bacterium]|nr:hypothetical protein [Verrucomicrobiota bacterium]